MNNKKEIVMKIAYKLFVVLLTAFLVYNLIFKKNSNNLIYVSNQIGVKGKITGYDRARGYKIYIDSSKLAFNFDKFENDSVIKNEALSYYLDYDDSINKEPNSDTLLLIRKGVKSKWIYKP